MPVLLPRARCLALLGLTLGLGSTLRAQDDLPPEFLRAHALVVRFLASSFTESREGEGDKGQPPELPPAGGAALTPGDPVSSRPPAGPQLPSSWTTGARRYTVTGAPVAIRLSGDGLVIVVQVTPYDHGKNGLLVVAQGQVWLRAPDGRISYHSAFESLNVGFGEPLYFFPLGMKPDGSAPIRVKIAVDRFGDPPSLPDSDEAAATESRKPGK